MESGFNISNASYQTALLSAREQALPKNMGEIEKTAKEFEAVFISEMLGQMFSGLEVDPVFGGGQGEEMFRSLLVQEYGKNLAATQGIGLSDQIQKMMIQLQEGKGE